MKTRTDTRTSRISGWHGTSASSVEPQTCLPVVFACILCLTLGCHSAKVAEPLTAKLGGNDPDAQMEFWHTLATRNLTSNDEAFHGLLLYVDGEDPATDYAGRVKTLKDRGLLDRSFDQPADQAVQR